MAYTDSLSKHQTLENEATVNRGCNTMAILRPSEFDAKLFEI